MQRIYLPDVAKLYFLRAQLETLPTLQGAKLRLYKPGLIITPITTLVELEAVQCGFPGYTPKALVNWSLPVIVEGQVITEPDAVTWQASAVTSQQAAGVYLTNGAGDRLLGVGPFLSPVAIPNTSELTVSIQMRFDSIFSIGAI